MMSGQKQPYALRTPVGLGSCLLLAGWALAAGADAPRPEYWPPERLPPLEARLIEAPSSVSRELDQIDVLIEAEAWEEAVDAMVRLIDRRAAEVVAVTDDHYLSLADACHWQIARWPAAARDAYRQRVDGAAEQLLRQALDKRDEATLHRIVERYFVSSAGDDALLALGDLALERGEYAAARGYYLRLSAKLWTPSGRPWGLALIRTDLEREAVRTAIERQFESPDTHPALLVYPDTTLPLAEVLARLTIVSIREGSLPRAEIESHLLRRLAPQAEGWIAGRQAPLAETVQQTLTAASQWPSPRSPSHWPTYGGSSRRGAVAPPVGVTDRQQWHVDLADPPLELAPSAPQMWLDGLPLLPEPTRQAPPLAAQPLTNDRAVVFYDAGTWRAVDRATGQPLFGEAGEVYREANIWDDALPSDGDRLLLQRLNVDGGRRVGVQIRIGNVRAAPGAIALQALAPRSAASTAPSSAVLAALDGDMLYAVLGPRAGESASLQTSEPPAKRLRGLDLAAEGKLQLDIPPDEGYQFSGPPIVTEHYLYVPLREVDSNHRLQVACYRRNTGRQVWQVPVCSFVGGDPELIQDILTYANGQLFLNTSAGAVIAVRASDGRVAWARTYQRGQSTVPGDLSHFAARQAGPCLAADGVLVCAPADCSALFALDPVTGNTLWVNPQASDATNLLAVADGRLIATGERLWLIDLATGQSLFAWPEVATPGLAGQGRGCVAGGEVFWPTTAGIYTFNLSTGQQTRLPIRWQHLGEPTATSLVPCREGLLVATANRLTLLGEASPPSPPDEPPTPTLGLATPGSALSARRPLQSN